MSNFICFQEVAGSFLPFNLVQPRQLTKRIEEPGAGKDHKSGSENHGTDSTFALCPTDSGRGQGLDFFRHCIA